jgi:penicillin-binding protein-related factor A (putative recombinase)
MLHSSALCPIFQAIAHMESQNSEPCYHFVLFAKEYTSFSLDFRQMLDFLQCDIDKETEKTIQTFPIRKYVAVVQYVH